MSQSDSLRSSEPRPAGVSLPPNLFLARKDAACLEQARCVLVECFGLNLGQADKLLQNLARRCNRSMQRVSAVLIHQVWAGDEAAWDHSVARVVEDALRDLPDAIVRSAGAEGNCPQIAAG